VDLPAALYVQQLRSDGVVVVPNFLDSRTIAAMREAIPPSAAFTESPEGERAYYFADADRIEALNPFFGSSVIRSVAQGYISERATALRRTIGLKLVKGEIPSFESNYHMDTWKQRLKAFLYLEDVGSRDAPLLYLRGSHRGLWRLLTEARISRYYRTTERGYASDRERFFLGSFWPHEVAQLKRDFGYEELLCAGPAGTLVLFDGRGLHKATPLYGERRLILASYWIHGDDHI
jgi:hypothetical protein